MKDNKLEVGCYGYVMVMLWLCYGYRKHQTRLVALHQNMKTVGLLLICSKVCIVVQYVLYNPDLL